MHILPFAIAGQRGGICLNAVREVVRAVAVTPLPTTPAIIEGVINLRGETIPVVNLRQRFGLEPKSTELTDRFIVINAAQPFALHVESAEIPVALDEEGLAEAAEDSLAEAIALAGISATPDGLVLIYDPSSFFTSLERKAIEAALEGRV